MMSKKYLGSAIEANVDTAMAQIDTNCGWPDGAGTDQWADKQEQTLVSDSSTVYIFDRAGENGSHGFTRATMEASVTGMTEYDDTEIDWPAIS